MHQLTHQLKHNLARLALALNLAAVAAVGLAIPASAADVTGTVTIAGGGLSMAATAGPDFGSVAQSISPTGTVAGPVSTEIDVKDLRGTGGGWNLQITSTQFSTGGTDPKTLPTTATKVTAAIGACDAGTTCVVPVSTIVPPVTVPAGATAPAAVKFFNATALTGMGDMTITPAFTLTVPANSFAGTYTSTMTLTVAAAP